MAPREYRLGRRAEAAEETRRRIVEATYALHGEQGVAATSMKQIAARADVAIGTVYHHFPTYDDAIAACGAFSVVQHPLPDPAPLAVGPIDRRARAFVQAMADWHAGWPGFVKVRTDRGFSPSLDAGLALFDVAVTELARAVLGDDATDQEVTVAAALVEPAVLDRLTGHELGDVLATWLRANRRTNQRSNHNKGE